MTAAAFSVTDRNRALSDRIFTYVRCRACHALSLADVPADLDRYYGSTYHELPSPEQLGQAAAGEAFKIEWLRRLVARGALTEIGAGFGIFACAAREYFDVTAIEMDKRCCAYLEDVVGVRSIASDAPAAVLAELAPSRVVALWHSLEHLPDPDAVLRAAAANLQGDGVLILAVPNPSALQFAVLRGRWAHVDAPGTSASSPSRRSPDGWRLGLQRVLCTTGDPAARHWNRFGWEYAIRLIPPAVRRRRRRGRPRLPSPSPCARSRATA